MRWEGEEVHIKCAFQKSKDCGHQHRSKEKAQCDTLKSKRKDSDIHQARTHAHTNLFTSPNKGGQRKSKPALQMLEMGTGRRDQKCQQEGSTVISTLSAKTGEKEISNHRHQGGRTQDARGIENSEFRVKKKKNKKGGSSGGVAVIFIPPAEIFRAGRLSWGREEDRPVFNNQGHWEGLMRVGDQKK